MATDTRQLEAPLLLNVKHAAALLGVSPNHFRKMGDTGRLGPLPVRLGRAVRWRREELEEWVKTGCPPRARWLAQKET